MSQPVPVEYISGSWQTPNFYVDRLMLLLTAEEWKVLTVAARLTFGYKRDRSRISTSEFKRLTGLCADAATKALKSLRAFGVIVLTEENDSRKNEGAEYAPVLDADAVDWEALEARNSTSLEKRKDRTKAASAIKAQSPIPSDRTGSPTLSVPQNTPIPSDGIPLSVGQNGPIPSDGNIETKGNQVQTKSKPNTSSPHGEAAPRRVPRKGKPPPSPTDHQRLMAAYREALGYDFPRPVVEGQAAKKLLENGYPVDEIIACYWHFKRQAFWTDKHLSLQSVLRDIGAWKNGPRGSNGHQRYSPGQSGTAGSAARPSRGSITAEQLREWDEDRNAKYQ